MYRIDQTLIVYIQTKMNGKARTIILTLKINPLNRIT